MPQRLTADDVWGATPADRESCRSHVGPAARGNSRRGSLNFGGAATTAGSLMFIAAGVDPRLRAFDVETGRELWSAELPVSAQVTPMTYQLAPDRKEFVVARPRR